VKEFVRVRISEPTEVLQTAPSLSGQLSQNTLATRQLLLIAYFNPSSSHLSITLEFLSQRPQNLIKQERRVKTTPETETMSRLPRGWAYDTAIENLRGHPLATRYQNKLDTYKPEDIDLFGDADLDVFRTVNRLDSDNTKLTNDKAADLIIRDYLRRIGRSTNTQYLMRLKNLEWLQTTVQHFRAYVFCFVAKAERMGVLPSWWGEHQINICAARFSRTLREQKQGSHEVPSDHTFALHDPKETSATKRNTNTNTVR
jgi:hypothetical protein